MSEKGRNAQTREVQPQPCERVENFATRGCVKGNEARRFGESAYEAKSNYSYAHRPKAPDMVPVEAML